MYQVILQSGYVLSLFLFFEFYFEHSYGEQCYCLGKDFFAGLKFNSADITIEFGSRVCILK